MKLDSRYLGRGSSFEENQAILSNIQPLIGRGYKRCSRHCYFLSIAHSSQDAVADLLEFGQISPRIKLIETLMQCKKEIHALQNQAVQASFDVGFSYQGLEKLKIKRQLLEVFRKKSPAFFDNAFVRASRHAGDTGESAPENWQINFQPQANQASFDVLLIVHIPITVQGGQFVENIDCLKTLENSLFKLLLGQNSPSTQLPFSLPLCAPWVERAMPLDDAGTEHFGYRDGVTSPVYSPSALKNDEQGYRHLHALGELLLGHPRNDGDNLYADLNLIHQANPYLDPQIVPRDESYKKFFQNSSFSVLRKMEQRVDQFDAWVEKTAQRLLPQDTALGAPQHKDSYLLAKRWIKSKIMGRTPEGLLLKPGMRYLDISPEHVREQLDRQIEEAIDPNVFRFHHRDDSARPEPSDDSKGLACPFSSHIRRMNPRDDAVTPFIHRPVLRRGMPFTSENSKGMLGLFFCADIVDQFEHLVGAWGQNKVMGVPDSSQVRDPILGQHEPQANRLFFDIPGQAESSLSASFKEAFVITRGCAYTWFPSLDVLDRFHEFQKS